MFKLRAPAGLILLSALLPACAPTATQPPDSTALTAAIQRAAASSPITALTMTPTTGGLRVNGRLNGRLFTAQFPTDWNQQAVYYTHGYTLPSPAQDTVATDLITQDDTGGLIPEAYRQGFAVARTVYDKRGFAVRSGIENTIALKRFIDQVGVQRSYVTGGSMGGSVLMGLIEKYPTDFVGALSACGAVSDWQFQVKYLTDFRAVFNYFTAGTAYALPGTEDVTRSAPGLKGETMVKALGPLFLKAKLNPRGPEQQLLDRIVSAVPGVQAKADITTFFNTLAAQLFGLDDINATAGGIFVQNTDTVYTSSLLSAEDNAALNRGIQRYTVSSPAAVAYQQDWYSATGRFQTKLLTYHNTADALVPFEHEARLRARVEAAGNTANLVQQVVDPKLETLSRVLFLKLEGVTHCGFTPAQNVFAWNELRQWVETGTRPQDGLNITRPPR
ncbi:hypothetical protein K7W42_22570 [Deinococcus sp. HMF7604]|uniref:alpha/beta hydrolase family protein n=1 Tax=Deinococcus betulae TaxID=2873312 RepID=UPI001CCC7F21|nr:hypothetical protein [Deinococcus betulae]MBZ9753611.1 hypothetical protein [Deinococcus betulae]